MMNLKKIRDVLSKKIPKPEGDYNRFSVLIPLVCVEGNYHLLFEVRSDNLNNQPGEICFPGGKVEAQEKPETSAVRETFEELNIPKSAIKLLGPLDYIVTPYNSIIYPFVGKLEIKEPTRINYNKAEVARVFTVPLESLLKQKPKVHHIYVKVVPYEGFPYEWIQNGRNYKWKTGSYPVFFYNYGNNIIWGITARILKSFLEVIKTGNK